MKLVFNRGFAVFPWQYKIKQEKTEGHRYEHGNEMRPIAAGQIEDRVADNRCQGHADIIKGYEETIDFGIILRPKNPPRDQRLRDRAGRAAQEIAESQRYQRPGIVCKAKRAQTCESGEDSQQCREAN